MSREDHLLHTPDETGTQKCEDLRRYFINLEEILETYVPASRELSLAKTKLEEARMWAIKGIVMEFPAKELQGTPGG